MNKLEVVLGIDIGTSSCKVCAVDVNGGRIAQESTRYETLVPHPGWAEQRPKDWLKAIAKSCRCLLRNAKIRPSYVRGISLSSAAHIAVLLDKKDEPLRNAILWLDQRSNSICTKLSPSLGTRILEITNNWVSPTWTLPHLLWISRNEPDTWTETRSILLSKDFISFCLTKNKSTDPSCATSSMLYDVNSNSWSEDLCSLGKISNIKLPEVYPASAIVGNLIDKAASILGVEKGIPVVNGSLDSTAETFCAKLKEPGDIAIRLASAGGVHVLMDFARPHKRLITYPFPIAPKWLVQGGTNSCATAVDWIRKATCSFKSVSYADWDTHVNKVEPGSEGLIFHPYLSGERCPYWDSKLQASFTRLSLKHSVGHIARSVYEGCAYSIFDALNMLKEVCPPVNRVTIMGGGANSRAWSSIMCDVLGVPVSVAPHIDSAYGAALMGLNGIGVFASMEDAQSRAKFETNSLVPDLSNHEIHLNNFDTYKAIHRALKPIYHKRLNRQGVKPIDPR
jgi:xylulokinase